MSSPHEKFDIGSLDIQEPLVESAMLAHQWSEAHCNECGSYHGAWQVLRLLGVLNSMRSDDDFLLTQLDFAVGNGARKILVSGAADYALQARIAAVARRHKARPRITVIDLCNTPLKLNRWYANRSGMDVDVLQGDILNYRMPDHFDLICTHSFLPFFNPDERGTLLRVWWDCLAPGGAVLTAQRTRPDDTSSRHGFSQAQADALGLRAYELAAEQYDRFAIDPEQARALAIGYALGRSTYVIRDNEQLRRLFLQQGFELKQFTLPGQGQLEKDAPSTPTRPGHRRTRILARKPVN